jgi:hypothetical protein
MTQNTRAVRQHKNRATKIESSQRLSNRDSNQNSETIDMRTPMKSLEWFLPKTWKSSAKTPQKY